MVRREVAERLQSARSRNPALVPLEDIGKPCRDLARLSCGQGQARHHLRKMPDDFLLLCALQQSQHCTAMWVENRWRAHGGFFQRVGGAHRDQRVVRRQQGNGLDHPPRVIQQYSGDAISVPDRPAIAARQHHRQRLPLFQ